MDFPRLFLKFWSGFYATAKHGDEKLGVGPEKFFGRDEAGLALKHAWNAGRLLRCCAAT